MLIEPRGFGFVTFHDMNAIDGVLAESEHYIDSKLVECKKAVPKETPISTPTGLINPTFKDSPTKVEH